MPSYINPSETDFVATDGDDMVTITDGVARSLDGSGGIDTITLGDGATGYNWMKISDATSPGSFSGSARANNNSLISFVNFEAFQFFGTSSDDFFEISASRSLAGTILDIDAGAGTDMLVARLGGMTTDILFEIGETGSNNIGSFKGFEDFQIVAGAGNDTIRTGAGSDSIQGGSGANIMEAGEGDDWVFSTSLLDSADGGDGWDVFAGGYREEQSAMTVRLTDRLTINGRVLATGFEEVEMAGGAANDRFDVRYGAIRSHIYGAGGQDRYSFDGAAMPGAVFSILDGPFSLGGQVRGTISTDAGIIAGFGEVETAKLVAGRHADAFLLSGKFTASQIHFDGGLGDDFLEANFDVYQDTTVFTVAQDGSISSNRGKFERIETFIIIGGAGNDSITTGAQDDILFGGAGRDTLSGGAGDDIIHGDDGNDYDGVDGDDYIDGGAGIDILDGGAGVDAMTKDFSDRTSGVTIDLTRDGEQMLRGEGSVRNFELFTGYMLGTLYDDVFIENGPLFAPFGGAGIDTDAGDDMVHSSTLDRDIRMGEGRDLLSIDLRALSSEQSVNFSIYLGDLSYGYAGRINASTSLNSIGSILFDRVEDFHISTGAGQDVLSLGDGNDMVDGGARPDQIFGVGGDDLLYGGSGNDHLEGGAGDDRLDGGRGADVMIGGVGDDVYFVNSTADLVVEKANGGDDRVYSTVSYSILTTHVERLILTGSGDTSAIGNNFANVLAGNDGDNILDGMGRSDILIGGGGGDLFKFSASLGTSNIDTIRDFSVADDTLGLSAAIFRAGPRACSAPTLFISGRWHRMPATASCTTPRPAHSIMTPTAVAMAQPCSSRRSPPASRLPMRIF